MTFHQTKSVVSEFVGLERDALHIYVGLMLFLGSALLRGWSLRDRRPWLVVLLAALAGEAWDWRDAVGTSLDLLVRSSWHDLWNTMFWPTALALLARGTNLLGR